MSRTLPASITAVSPSLRRSTSVSSRTWRTGTPDARISAIWRFRDLCDAAGVAPAFAGVGQGMLRAYEAAGMASVTLPDGRAMALSGDQDPQKVLRLLAAGGAGD